MVFQVDDDVEAAADTVAQWINMHADRPMALLNIARSSSL